MPPRLLLPLLAASAPAEAAVLKAAVFFCNTRLLPSLAARLSFLAREASRTEPNREPPARRVASSPSSSQADAARTLHDFTSTTSTTPTAATLASVRRMRSRRLAASRKRQLPQLARHSHVRTSLSSHGALRPLRCYFRHSPPLTPTGTRFAPRTTVASQTSSRVASRRRTRIQERCATIYAVGAGDASVRTTRRVLTCRESAFLRNGSDNDAPPSRQDKSDTRAVTTC